MGVVRVTYFGLSTVLYLLQRLHALRFTCMTPYVQNAIQLVYDNLIVSLRFSDPSPQPIFSVLLKPTESKLRFRLALLLSFWLSWTGITLVLLHMYIPSARCQLLFTSPLTTTEGFSHLQLKSDYLYSAICDAAVPIAIQRTGSQDGDFNQFDPLGKCGPVSNTVFWFSYYGHTDSCFLASHRETRSHLGMHPLLISYDVYLVVSSRACGFLASVISMHC